VVIVAPTVNMVPTVREAMNVEIRRSLEIALALLHPIPQKSAGCALEDCVMNAARTVPSVGLLPTETLIPRDAGLSSHAEMVGARVSSGSRHAHERTTMERGRVQLLRCAIYTREVLRGGLEQDVKRCAPSARHPRHSPRASTARSGAWSRTAYDDARFSDGTMEEF
jgi:hypothetical protein